MSTRHVLFYSEYCFFSKDVLSLIAKKNVSSLFLLVCVDAYRDQLPAFVQSVPTLLTHDRRVLEGECAHEFVMGVQGQGQGQGRGQGQGQGQGRGQGQGQTSGQDEEVPLDSSTSISAWSESYSFLEPSENRNVLGAFSGVMDDNGIECIPDDQDRKGKGKASVTATATPLSNYMANRDNDTEILRSQQLAKSNPQGLRR